MDSNSNQSPVAFSVLPSGDSCEKCNSTRDVQKFDGKRLCRSCRNQWASIH